MFVGRVFAGFRRFKTLRFWNATAQARLGMASITAQTTVAVRRDSGWHMYLQGTMFRIRGVLGLEQRFDLFSDQPAAVA